MEDRHPPRFLESWLLGDGAKSNHPATNSESPVVTGSLGLKRRHKKAVRTARRHFAIFAGRWGDGEIMKRGGHQLELGISHQIASPAYSSGALIIGHK